MSDDIEILPVEIHLPGLLKLLGEHLYSQPQVALREMVQNAHDSCVRRREEDPAVAGTYQPAIHITPDHAARQLIIEDTGSGLTREEISTFLATIGRGYTGELRERLGAAGREEAMDLIGLFGLGLLSAFMIASRIDILTASYQTPGVAWRWVSEGGQSYALRRATREEVGTTVRLDLRDDARFLLEPGVLSDALRAYAEFLPVPITVGEEREPINGHPAPWMQAIEPASARAIHYAAWVEERRRVKPLTVLPLEDVRTEDGRVIPLRGVLYVPPRSVISLQEYGDVTVYVRHMLITEHERDLLPEWARFVTGIIDCPLLNPTASRETLRHDEVFTSVQKALAGHLLAHFQALAEDAPLDWAAIVQAHNDLIKGWAVRSPELFTRVADLVRFKTSRGQLTLPEYLHENPGRIFYYDEDEGVTQTLALFEARRLAVIDARWFADTAFLKRYSEMYGVPIEELEPAAGYLFTPVDDPEGQWKPILEACQAEGFPARLLAYEPEHLPMILLYPPGAERLRRAQQQMEQGRFASPIRRLVRGYLDKQQMDETVIKGVLHLNVRNPLLRRLRELGPAHPHFAALLSILVANARMFAGQNLSAQDTISCFEQINRSLSQLVGLSDALRAGKTPLTLPVLTELGLHPDAARQYLELGRYRLAALTSLYAAEQARDAQLEGAEEALSLAARAVGAMPPASQDVYQRLERLGRQPIVTASAGAAGEDSPAAPGSDAQPPGLLEKTERAALEDILAAHMTNGNLRGVAMALYRLGRWYAMHEQPRAALDYLISNAALERLLQLPMDDREDALHILTSLQEKLPPGTIAAALAAAERGPSAILAPLLGGVPAKRWRWLVQSVAADLAEKPAVEPEPEENEQGSGFNAWLEHVASMAALIVRFRERTDAERCERWAAGLEETAEEIEAHLGPEGQGREPATLARGLAALARGAAPEEVAQQVFPPFNEVIEQIADIAQEPVWRHPGSSPLDFLVEQAAQRAVRALRMHDEYRQSRLANLAWRFELMSLDLQDQKPLQAIERFLQALRALLLADAPTPPAIDPPLPDPFGAILTAIHEAGRQPAAEQE